MVNVASLMSKKENKPEIQTQEDNSTTVTDTVKDIPSIPNVPEDAKATTATPDGKVDVGTDTVKDASADVTAKPVDYNYNKEKNSYKLNTLKVPNYSDSSEADADYLNLMADQIENGDYEGFRSAYLNSPEEVQMIVNEQTGYYDLGNFTTDIIASDLTEIDMPPTGKISRETLKKNAPQNLISALRNEAEKSVDYKVLTPTAKANTPVKPAPVNTTTTAKVNTPVVNTPVKPAPVNTTTTAKVNTPVVNTPVNTADDKAEPHVETPEEHQQKIVEYTKNLVDSKILEGQKPEDINWTDKKITDNITTNYNLLDDEHKAEAEKQLNKLATGNPEAEAAIKDAIINAKSSKWNKFWRDAGKWMVDKAHWLYDNRLTSNKQTFDEWINDNPSVLGAVFGNSGLNFGERLGNAVGLAAAMTSDVFKGVYEGANGMANSGPTATKEFITPYKSIAVKNIEQIVKNKEGTAKATSEQAEAAQKFKALKVAKYFPNEDVTNMLAVAANPNGDLSRIYDDDATWHKAYMNAHPNVKEEDIDTKYAADFLNFKKIAWDEITNSLIVDKNRLDNTEAMQKIDMNKIVIAQQVHNLNFHKFEDWNEAKLQLQNKLTELYELRRQAKNASDKAQLIDLSKKFKDLITGMSSTSSTTGTSKTGTTTKSSSNTVGGNARFNVKLAAAGSEASHTGSNVNAETNADNNTITLTADTNTQDVLDFANNDKLKGEFTAAKNEYLNSIESMIQQIQFMIKQIETMSKADNSISMSDERLKNIFSIGSYIPDANYYRNRLNLV